MNEDKIQTGLRIPQSRYDELKDMADKAGISLNAMILFLKRAVLGFVLCNKPANDVFSEVVQGTALHVRQRFELFVQLLLKTEPGLNFCSHNKTSAKIC